MKLDITRIYNFAGLDEVKALAPKAMEANTCLHQGTGKGSDFLGWLALPSEISREHLNDIKSAAATLCEDTDFVIVIGIGGSYLGSKCVIEALSHNFAALVPAKGPRVIFAGQNISEDYLYELLETVKGKKISCVVISKSGTTTEPAVAFRVFKEFMENAYGKEACQKRIVAITDAKRGALRTMADQEGYKTFIIPDNVGGRFSVLTPVGLLPIACAGLDIDAFVAGAKEMQEATSDDVPFEQNPSAVYAAARNVLYAKGKKIEILANYNPKLHFIAEWWKQLYGESEGKDGLGIFPASVDFSADLHSMGQYIQDGERHLMETVLSIAKAEHEVRIPNEAQNLDGLNFLAGKRFEEINAMAELGTMLAHVDGGVPNMRIELPSLNEHNLGMLLYFFEKACGISGYILGVNPFDQPGVEAYKKNMFALLKKPGYEKESEEIQQRLFS